MPLTTVSSKVLILIFIKFTAAFYKTILVSSLALISRIIQTTFKQIHLISVSGHFYLHSKICQTVAGISSSNELDEASPPPIIEQVEEVTEAPIVYKGLAEPGEPELGPKLFYDGKDFLMKLGGPIRVTIFSGPAKGQLISKCPFEMTVSSKIPTKLLLDFCPDFFL